MARLSALLDLMASQGVAPRETLDVYARKMREACLISPGLKGIAVQSVPPADAAALILATMASDSPSAAPRLFPLYAGLGLAEPFGNAGPEAPDGLAEAWDARTAIRCLTDLLSPSVAAVPARPWLPQAKAPGPVRREGTAYDVVLGRTHPGLMLVVRPSRSSVGEATHRSWGHGPSMRDAFAVQVRYSGEAIDEIAALVADAA